MIEKSVFKRAAERGTEEILAYFDAPPDARDSEAAIIGVKAAGNFAKLYSAETNRMAVTLAHAKAVGADVESLDMAMEEITGLKLLPQPVERSGGGAKSKRATG